MDFLSNVKSGAHKASAKSKSAAHKASDPVKHRVVRGVAIHKRKKQIKDGLAFEGMKIIVGEQLTKAATKATEAAAKEAAKAAKAAAKAEAEVALANPPTGKPVVA